MQALDFERKRRALEQIEKRGLRSLETSFEKQRRIRGRAGHDHMPLVQFELSLRGRKAVPHKAKNRYTSELGRELREVKETKIPDPAAAQDRLQDDLARAARGETGEAAQPGGDTERASSQSPLPELLRDFQPDGRDKDRSRGR